MTGGDAGTHHEVPPDPNQDGNSTDARDTDNDGSPDHLDPDDDRDGDPHAFQQANAADENRDSSDASDGDGQSNSCPKFLDSDDDGAGTATIHEDRDGDGNVDDDDEDGLDGDLDADDDRVGVSTQGEVRHTRADGDSAFARDGDHDGRRDAVDADHDRDFVLAVVAGVPGGDGGRSADHRHADDDGGGLTCTPAG